MELKELVKEYLEKNERTQIYYDIDRGELEINGKRYSVGELSFTEVGGAVKEALRELFGDYRTIPYTFNSEAYENEKFRAEVLALGFEGLLRFRVVKRKE